MTEKVLFVDLENVQKVDIARYIGVSPATLRNYTGLARLIGRGGLFAQIVELMDVGVIPASNPYAWLRLNDDGVRHVLELLRAEFALDLLLCGLANWLPWTAPSLSQRNSRSAVESGL